MCRKDMLMLSLEERKRLHLIKKAIGKELRQVEAAELADISFRQFNRLVGRVKKKGDAGVVHGLRGKASKRRIGKEIRDKALGLYRRFYRGFGPTLASEKLEENHGIRISDESLRGMLLGAGEWRRQRRVKQHRQWRERKGRFGEMVQMDGSHHDWLEGRGPGMVLMGYIDDATGTVYGRFYEYEGTQPALDSFRRYVRRYGVPQSVYLDRHTTYKSPAKPTIEEELKGEKPLSQFERALKELRVRVIHAYSPQAKGRVERLFRTFQDRLVKEMRLKKVRTLEKANDFLEGYLPIYNRRFAILAREEGNLHRRLPVGATMNRILCQKAQRTLRNDFTVFHEKQLYQILDPVQVRHVLVENWTNGTMKIYAGAKVLRFKAIAINVAQKRSVKRQKAQAAPQKPGSSIPGQNHPWRRLFLIPKSKTQKQDISTLVKIGHS